MLFNVLYAKVIERDTEYFSLSALGDDPVISGLKVEDAELDVALETFRAGISITYLQEKDLALDISKIEINLIQNSGEKY